MPSEDLKKAQASLDRKVLGKPGIEGTAIGLAGDKPCLKVYVSDAKASRSVPSKVDGVKVVVENTGTFRRH